MGWSIGKDVLAKHNVHASEYSWVNTEFDAVFDNNATLDHLFNQVETLVESEVQLHQLI